MRDLLPGLVPLRLTQGPPALHPEELIWLEMLDGWRNQQLGRNLSPHTIDQRISNIERFRSFTEKYPWNWEASDIDEYSMELRGVRRLSRSTMLTYQVTVRLFMEYLTDSSYGWSEECFRRFGSYPAQIAFEWNTARHRSEVMSDPKKRPYSREELQSRFDCADDHVARARRAGRKGWIPWYRTSIIMKTAYAWGLRRNEVRQLELSDFGHNPAVKKYKDFGTVYVRHGKAKAGSPPKRRTVLTIPETDWAVDCLSDWINDVRPRMSVALSYSYLFPSERGGPLTADALSAAFSSIRKEAGLADGLDFHSLRRSYITHLVESGYDGLFIQQQAGHEYGSTTAICTGVSPDYRNKVVQQALRSMATDATHQRNE